MRISEVVDISPGNLDSSFYTYLPSLIITWEPERFFHYRSQTVCSLCLELPEVPVLCRVKPKALASTSLQCPPAMMLSPAGSLASSPTTDDLTGLHQPPWCLHRSSLRAFEPTVTSARTTVASIIRITSQGHC